MAKTEIKVIAVHVPLALSDAIDKIAARTNCSRDWIVTQALAEWIDREKERSRWTREGLDSVGASRVVDHEAVRGWAESLGTDKPLPLPVPRS